MKINVPLNQDMKPVFVLITKADGFSNNDEYNSVKIYNDNYVSYYIDDWGNQDWSGSVAFDTEIVDAYNEDTDTSFSWKSYFITFLYVPSGAGSDKAHIKFINGVNIEVEIS